MMKKLQMASLIDISCYLSPFWIFSYLYYKIRKNEFDPFHIRQGLGLFIIWLIVFFMMYVPLLGILMILVFMFIMPVLSIIGMNNAYRMTHKELPLIGKLISETLKNFK
jgi:uncharacterized membrane protein